MVLEEIHVLNLKRRPICFFFSMEKNDEKVRFVDGYDELKLWLEKYNNHWKETDLNATHRTLNATDFHFKNWEVIRILVCVDFKALAHNLFVEEYSEILINFLQRKYFFPTNLVTLQIEEILLLDDFRREIAFAHFKLLNDK